MVSLPHTDPVRHATQTLIRLESGMKLSVVPRVLRVTKGMQHCAIKEGLCASAATVRDAVRMVGRRFPPFDYGSCVDHEFVAWY